MKNRRHVRPLDGIAGLDVVLSPELNRTPKPADRFLQVVLTEGLDGLPPWFKRHEVESAPVLIGLGDGGHVRTGIAACGPDHPRRSEGVEGPAVDRIFGELELGDLKGLAKHLRLRTPCHQVLHAGTPNPKVITLLDELQSILSQRRVLKTVERSHEYSVGCQHTLRDVVGHYEERLGLVGGTTIDTPADPKGQRHVLQALPELFKVRPLGDFVSTLVFFLTAANAASKRGDSLLLTTGHGRLTGHPTGSRSPELGGNLFVDSGRSGRRMRSRGQK